MRISDWSSDVCSSDLEPRRGGNAGGDARHHLDRNAGSAQASDFLAGATEDHRIAGFQPHDMLALAGQPHHQCVDVILPAAGRSEEHTSELQSLMRISYAVFCLNKKNTSERTINTKNIIN